MKKLPFWLKWDMWLRVSKYYDFKSIDEPLAITIIIKHPLGIIAKVQSLRRPYRFQKSILKLIKRTGDHWQDIILTLGPFYA